jgi:hypothetical protein
MLRFALVFHRRSDGEAGLRAEPLVANSPQLVSHPAVLRCELAVASGVFPELLATTTAVFGRLFNCLCGSVLTVCGVSQAFGRGDQAGGCKSLGCCGLPLRFLRQFTSMRYVLGGLHVTPRLGLVAAFHVRVHCDSTSDPHSPGSNRTTKKLERVPEMVLR